MRSIKFADLGRHPQPAPLHGRGPTLAATPAPAAPPASGSTLPVPAGGPVKQPKE